MRTIGRAFRREPSDKDETQVKATAAKAVRRGPQPAAQPTVRFQFFRDVAAELRKVTWPTREEVTRLTILVTAMSIAVGAFLGILDYTFTESIRLILSLGR